MILLMEKTLKDCRVGDKVRLWCAGWRDWDNELVIIKDNGVSTLIKVQYNSGSTSEFSYSTPCIVVEASNVQ